MKNRIPKTMSFSLVIVSLLLGGCEHSTSSPDNPSPPLSLTGAPSNVIFVLVDDLSNNLLPHMPNVQQMKRDGMTFENYFVSDSLCCPSRSTIFTGKYPHNTGVFTNTEPDGGFPVFKERGNDKETFAVALQAAGYQTAMMGKYMNLYLPAQHPPEPGWTNWVVAGNGYGEYNYRLNVNGQLENHARKPEDYLTDVLSHRADEFVRANAAKPFFIEIATFAPHGPYTPAPRHVGLFADLKMPLTPDSNVKPENAAQWLTAIPQLNAAQMNAAEADFRKRVRSVQAVDEMIGRLRTTLKELAIDQNTVILFSSDNGFHLGDHGMRGGKQTAFDHDIRVPLIAVGPSIPAGSSTAEIVQNTDLCPTFSAIAGAQCPNPDGSSLLSLLLDPAAKIGKNLALVEHRNAGYNPLDPDQDGQRGNPPSYKALRGPDFTYVSYETGEREYYDLKTDKDQLHNIYSMLSAEQKAKLEDKALTAEICKGTASCKEALSWP